MISIQAAVSVIVYLIVAGMVFWLLFWLLNFIAPPEPFRKVATVILAIMAVLVIISMLLSFAGGTPIFRM